MLEHETFNPQSIAERRGLPALLILGDNGKVVSNNETAKQFLLSDSNCLQAVRAIGERLSAHGKLNFRKQVLPTEPVLTTVVSEGQYTYSLQAFWIDGHSDPESSRMAVLLEKIKPIRSDVSEVTNPVCHLAAREVEVIRALKRGLTDKEIASILGLSPSTVRSYLKTIRGKLGVSTRTAILHALHA